MATLPPASGPGAAQGITSVAAAGTISVAFTIGVSFVVSAFSALPPASCKSLERIDSTSCLHQILHIEER